MAAPPPGLPTVVARRREHRVSSARARTHRRRLSTGTARRQEHSRRPGTPPTRPPDALEAEIVRLRQALSPDGSGPVSADVIRDHLRQHGGDVLPSRRTIYRILNRQAKEVNSHRQTEKKSDEEGLTTAAT